MFASVLLTGMMLGQVCFDEEPIAYRYQFCGDVYAKCIAKGRLPNGRYIEVPILNNEVPRIKITHEMGYEVRTFTYNTGKEYDGKLICFNSEWNPPQFQCQRQRVAEPPPRMPEPPATPRPIVPIPDPKAEPAPRVEPPRVEPKVEPRVEPKREPRVEPKREPRVESRPGPKTDQPTKPKRPKVITEGVPEAPSSPVDKSPFIGITPEDEPDFTKSFPRY